MRRTFAAMVSGVLISMGFAACTTGSSPDAADVSAHTRVRVPQGTYITIELQDAISTENNSPGDPFSASVSKDVIVHGLTAFERGDVVHGRVMAVQEPGRTKGLAQLTLKLTSVEHHGQSVPIQTQMYVGIAHNAKGEEDSAQNNQVSYPPDTRLLFTLSSPVDI